MPKPKKTHEISIHGAMGYGPTAADAKAHAASRIEAAFAECFDYTPVVLTFPRGELGFIFRQLEGWTYRIIWPNELAKQRITLWSSGGAPRMQDAEIACRRDIAAQAYWNDQGTEYGLKLLHPKDTEGIRTQQRQRVFQLAYKEYAAKGEFTEAQCHYLACQAMDKA